MAQLARDEAGNVWEVDAQGNAVRLVTPASAPAGPQVVVPESPVVAAKNASELRSEALTQQRTAQQIAAGAPQVAYAPALTAAELEAKRLGNEKARQDLAAPNKDAQGIKDRAAQLDAVANQINEMQSLYNQGIGATSGARGILDYLPTDINARFDTAANSLEERAAAAFRVPGSGDQSDADAARVAAANKPNRFARDSVTVQQLKQLRERVDTQRKALGLGPAEWKGLTTAATGATKTERDPKRAATLNALIRGGADINTINATMVGMGGTPVDPGDIAAARDYLRKNPGYKGSLAEATNTTATTARERASGSAAGAFLANAANDALAGVPAATFGNQDALDLQRRAFPSAALAGSLVGGVAGAAGVEAGLAAGAARLGGGIAGRVLANPITADAVYGGVQGQASGDTPLSGMFGAGAGVAGGLVGRGVTRAIGGGVGGVANADVAALRDRGVPLTFGQAVGGSGRLGAAIKGVEDRLTGIPVIGDIINARRLEGFQGFNRAAFDEGLAPIGATTGGEIAEQGVDLARAARSQAYRDTLDPVNVRADNPFANDLANTVRAGTRLPQDLSDPALYNVRRAVENFTPGGELSGEAYQQAIRRFRREASLRENLPNGNDFGNVMRQGEATFEGLLARQSPQTIPAYRAANAANRNVEVLRDAVTRARNGTRVGEAGVFAPSQLADAGAANARRFGNSAGTTNQPFFELSRAGQNVLPSRVADSGTAGRAIAAGSLGLAGTTGAGYAAGDPGAGAGTGLGLGLLLAAGGSRAGQRALTSALLDRPDFLRRFGAEVAARPRLGGMFGAGSLPVLISDQ